MSDETTTAVIDDERFAFGKNWARYLEDHFNEEAVGAAIECMKDLLDGYDLAGKTFVDIGCGSGLHSLVALRLGASRIVSFDYDPESVKCTEMLHDHEGKPENWQVMPGSALDREFLASLGTFDVVYSWGVLHHTGAMWDAIDASATMTADDGVFFIAIYNKAEAFGIYPDGRFGPARLWVPLKRLYSKSPMFVKNVLDTMAMSVFVFVCLLTLKNPRRVLGDYKAQRGMSLKTDIRDWFGGYPYEYAAPDEIFRFMKQRGYLMTNIKCHPGLRCSEYVFLKRPVPVGPARPGGISHE